MRIIALARCVALFYLIGTLRGLWIIVNILTILSRTIRSPVIISHLSRATTPGPAGCCTALPSPCRRVNRLKTHAMPPPRARPHRHRASASPPRAERPGNSVPDRGQDWGCNRDPGPHRHASADARPRTRAACGPAPRRPSLCRDSPMVMTSSTAWGVQSTLYIYIHIRG